MNSRLFLFIFMLRVIVRAYFVQRKNIKVCPQAILENYIKGIFHKNRFIIFRWSCETNAFEINKVGPCRWLMNLCSNVPSNLRPGKNLIMLYKQLVILYKPPFDKYLICLKDINEMFYQILITECSTCSAILITWP